MAMAVLPVPGLPARRMARPPICYLNDCYEIIIHFEVQMME
jgi:hypothetical protein